MQKKRLNWFLINENYGANLYPFAIHFDADYHGFKKAFGRGMEYQAVGTENGFLRQDVDRQRFYPENVTEYLPSN